MAATVRVYVFHTVYCSRAAVDALRGSERKIAAALAKGDKGILKVAREHGVGNGTVQRVKAAMAA